MQWQQAVVRRPRANDIAGERRGTHLGHQLGRNVGRHGNHTVATHQHERQPGDVIAAVDREVGLARGRERSDELAAASEVGGCIFETDDARHLRETQHGIEAHGNDPGVRLRDGLECHPILGVERVGSWCLV